MGRSVVVSNTFTKEWEMKPYLDMAKEMIIPVTVYRMTQDFGSIHNVPSEAIDKMRNRFEDYPGEISK